eukprot:scaffold98698_cov29-Tisochrysis_lutea.AAC.1
MSSRAGCAPSATLAVYQSSSSQRWPRRPRLSAHLLCAVLTGATRPRSEPHNRISRGPFATKLMDPPSRASQDPNGGVARRFPLQYIDQALT